jgi:hypothetical protein
MATTKCGQPRRYGGVLIVYIYIYVCNAAVMCYNVEACCETCVDALASFEPWMPQPLAADSARGGREQQSEARGLPCAPHKEHGNGEQEGEKEKEELQQHGEGKSSRGGKALQSETQALPGSSEQQLQAAEACSSCGQQGPGGSQAGPPHAAASAGQHFDPLRKHSKVTKARVGRAEEPLDHATFEMLATDLAEVLQNLGPGASLSPLLLHLSLLQALSVSLAKKSAYRSTHDHTTCPSNLNTSTRELFLAWEKEFRLYHAEHCPNMGMNPPLLLLVSWPLEEQQVASPLIMNVAY